MSLERGYSPSPEEINFSMDRNETTSPLTEADEQVIIESPTYEYEPTPAETLKTSYGKVLLERTLEEYPEASDEERLDAQKVFAEIDSQQIENLEIVESSRYPGVKFTTSKVVITPETIQRIYGQENKIEELGSDQSPAPQKKTIVLWGSFAFPPDGHALSMGDSIYDRAIQEIGMVSRRMDTDQPIEVEIQILGSPTGLGGEVTNEYIEELHQRGLEASSDMYAAYIEQQLLPEDFRGKSEEEQNAVLEGQQFLFEGASRGAILADMAYERMPESFKKLTSRRLDNPAGHHGDSRLWMLKAIQAGVGLGREYVRNLRQEESPLKDLQSHDKQLYAAMEEKLGVTKQPEQSKMKRRAILEELKALGRGESLSEDATRRYIVQAVTDLLTMNPYKRAMKIKRYHPGTLASNMTSTEEGAEFGIKGGHFYSPFVERYKTDEDGNLGTWWRMILAGRRNYNKLRSGTKEALRQDTKTAAPRIEEGG